MVRYITTVHKVADLFLGPERWSNVYHVEAADPEAALDIGVSIANIEQQVYKDYVTMSRVTVVEDQPEPPPGSSRVLTGAGDVTGDPDTLLPLFNSVRCTFSDGNGRPSQKYLRLPLEEADVTNGRLTITLINFVFLNYVTDLIALAGVVSNSGDTFIEGSVVHAVQMRQLNWKRRSRPGFRRGWVAE